MSVCTKNSAKPPLDIPDCADGVSAYICFYKDMLVCILNSMPCRKDVLHLYVHMFYDIIAIINIMWLTCYECFSFPLIDI